MMEKKEKAGPNKGEERRKLIGIFLIMLILIFYVITLLNKLYNREGEGDKKQERVEQLIEEIQDGL